MPRHAWTHFAYQLIEPDQQMDLFACQEVRLHLVACQLELGTPSDRTLCGGLLPAKPLWRPLDKVQLRDSRLCAACLKQLEQEKRGGRLSWVL